MNQQGQQGQFYNNQPPQYGQPVYGQPVYGQPASGQPVPQYQYEDTTKMNKTHQHHHSQSDMENQKAPLLNSSGERFQYGPTEWRDKWWVVAFVLHLVGIAIVAGVYGHRMMKDLNNEPPPQMNQEPDLSASEQRKLVWMLIASAAMAAVFASMWLAIMKRCADTIIKLSLFASVCCLGAAAAVSLVLGNIVGAIIYIVIALIQVLYFYCVRNRIPFAQATLSASVSSLQEHSGPIYVTYFVTFIQILWMGVWCFTFVSVYHASAVNNNDAAPADPDAQQSTPSNSINGFVYFVLLTSLYWTQQVLKNIAHVTTAGTVASWWLVPSEASPTMGAFKRACTTSLGSICLGSLIVAVLKAVRAMLRQAEQQARQSGNNAAQFVLCFVSCLLGMIERAVQYFNIYAYTQVAVYGKDFITAAKDTWALFMARGFDIIINDDLTGMVLAMGCLMVGAATGLVGAILAHALDFNGWWVLAILCFIIGYLMAVLVMGVVESAVATTFVVWAEDPAACSETRPTEFNAIKSAAELMYPGRQF